MRRFKDTISGILILGGIMFGGMALCTSLIIRYLNRNSAAIKLINIKLESLRPAKDTTWHVDIDTIYMTKGKGTDTVHATWYRIK